MALEEGKGGELITGGWEGGGSVEQNASESGGSEHFV